MSAAATQNQHLSGHALARKNSLKWGRKNFLFEKKNCSVPLFAWESSTWQMATPCEQEKNSRE